LGPRGGTIEVLGADVNPKDAECNFGCSFESRNSLETVTGFSDREGVTLTDAECFCVSDKSIMLTKDGIGGNGGNLVGMGGSGGRS
jgi:hypothetical protein